MKKRLEGMEKDKLDKIAEQQGIFNPQSMTKKELINKILDINGYEVKEIKPKVVKHKTLRSVKIDYAILFLMIILVLLMSVIKIFTQYYFTATSMTSRDKFGGFIQMLSFLWTCYIMYFYWKYKRINFIMLINVVLSICYFIYFMFGYWDNIHSYLEIMHKYGLKITDFNKKVQLYYYLFFVWIGLTSGLALIAGSLVLYKVVFYK